MYVSTRLVFIPQGILLVYDITNSWSFDGIDRWIREIDEVILFNLVYKEIQDIHGKWVYILCLLPSRRNAKYLLVSTV